MRTPRNPYRWNVVDPAIFYGRQQSASHLADRLVGGDRFAVTGGRRMGKTTLLRRLEGDLRRIGAESSAGGLAVLPVFVDANELRGGSRDRAYRLLMRRVTWATGAAALTEPAGEGLDGIAFADAILALVQAWRSRHRLQIVFLFDEIEAVLSAEWGPDFLTHWRMLLNNMGELSRSVSAVFCGAGGIYRIAQDVGSPLGNILAWHELRLFSREETARLVREPCGYDWPDPVVDRIYQTTGGQPCLTQFLMQSLCEDEVEDWPRVLPAAERRFRHEQGVIFQNWWRNFDEVARSIYADLLRAGILAEGAVFARFPEGGKRALDVLAHTGVVRWDTAGRLVELAGTLFRDWALDSGLAGPAAGQPDPVGSLAGDLPTPARDRPIGTVLFTDIVSSTVRTRELGDRGWRRVLEEHNAQVRAALATYRGREVNTTGDGFLALFDAPTRAIECACTIGDSLRHLGVEIRAGLHTGEYEVIGDDVTGAAVNFGSWVMSKARPGEVLVSSTLRGVVAGSGIQFRDRGAYAVKGSRERHRLFAVERPQTSRVE